MSPGWLIDLNTLINSESMCTNAKPHTQKNMYGQIIFIYSDCKTSGKPQQTELCNENKGRHPYKIMRCLLFVVYISILCDTCFICCIPLPAALNSLNQGQFTA